MRASSTPAPARARKAPWPEQLCCNQAGIAGLTLVQAAELARYGITANCLAPAARTSMTEGAHARYGQEPESGFDVWDPMNVASIVVWLGSSQSRHVTGRCFKPRGGELSVADGWFTGKINDKQARWEPAELSGVVDQLIAEGKGSSEGLRDLSRRIPGHGPSLPFDEELRTRAIMDLSLERRTKNDRRKRRGVSTGKSSTAQVPKDFLKPRAGWTCPGQEVLDMGWCSVAYRNRRWHGSGLARAGCASGNGWAITCTACRFDAVVAVTPLWQSVGARPGRVWAWWKRLAASGGSAFWA